IGYPVVSFEMIMYDLRAMGPRGGGGVEVVRDSFGFALLAVAGATCVVARIGLARQILGAAYAATVASVFALPFVANVSRSIYEAPALMATYAPTALGLVLGASLAWFRRREREALQAL